MDHSEDTTPKDSIWFEDGDLVIKVIEDGETFLHRVHATIMRHNSEVFRDLLTFSGSKEQEMIQGCPAVQLHDEPDSVFLLLKALYFPGALPHQKLRQATFDVLEPIIRLADKYQMHTLTKQLLLVLQKDWPSSLAEWDANEAEIKVAVHILEPERSERRFGDYKGVNFADELLPEPCRVIRLARECGFHSLLPAAFYHLSRTQLERDWDLDDDDFDELHQGARRAATKHLQLEDWRSLNTGMLEIRKWCSRFKQDLWVAREVTQAQRCEEHKCGATFKRCMGSLSEKLIESCMTRGLDFLGILLSYEEGEFNNLCFSCQTRIEKRIREGREELWNELRSMFNLPEVPIMHTSLSDDSMPL